MISPALAFQEVNSSSSSSSGPQFSHSRGCHGALTPKRQVDSNDACTKLFVKPFKISIQNLSLAPRVFPRRLFYSLLPSPSPSLLFLCFSVSSIVSLSLIRVHVYIHMYIRTIRVLSVCVCVHAMRVCHGV